MEFTDVLKIVLSGGGFFGIATVIIKSGITNLPADKKAKIITMVLLLGFILTAGCLLLAFYTFKNDGGEQTQKMGFKTESFIFREAKYQPNCSAIKTGDFTIWLSFNENKPYYITHETNSNLRVVLKSIDASKATFEVWSGENQILITPQLASNNSIEFSWQNCRCKLTYLAEGNFREGILLLMKERKTAKYKMEVI